MKRLFILVSILALLCVAGIASAQTVDMDLNGSTVEITGQHGIRLHHVTVIVDGQPADGQYWADFQWNPYTYTMDLVNGGVEAQFTGNGTTTLLGSASDFTVNTATAVLSAIDVSHCDRIRFNISVLPPPGGDSITCLILDPVTQVPLDSTSSATYFWTSVIQPLTQSISVQCSALNVEGSPGAVHVSYALYCR